MWKPRRQRNLVLFAVLAGLMLGGCAKDESIRPVPRNITVVSSATLELDQPIPPPTGRVVLTIKNVPNANRGNDLRLDLALLNAMGTISYEVFDRQALEETLTFSGPKMSTILDYAGLRAASILAVGLDDYQVSIPTKDFSEMPVILATAAEGKPMTISRFGPTRVIYPGESEGFSLGPEFDERWIWQLKSLEAE